MYGKAVSYGILIILVALLDIGFISSLPFGLHRIHALPIAVVFAILLSNVRGGAWWVLGGGLILEAFSFHSYGWYFLALFCVLGVASFLFEKVFTNRSLYSVSSVIAAAIFVYDLVLLVRDYSIAEPVRFSLGLLGNEVFGILLNIILSLALFYLFNLASRRLRPVFLPVFHRYRS